MKAMHAYLLTTVGQAVVGEVTQDLRMTQVKEITEVQTIVRKGDESE